MVFIGYLFNNYEYYPECGWLNENTIVKNGSRKSLIKIPKVSELNSYLELEKQRYKCKNCIKRFTAKTNFYKIYKSSFFYFNFMILYIYNR